MVPVPTVRGLVPPAAAILGFWIMSRMQRVRETAIGNIAAIAARASAKPSTQPVTAILMEAGNSIHPASTGAPALAGTAVRRTMTTLRTA